MREVDEMDERREMEAQEKREVEERHETTTEGKRYAPHTDISESEDALTVVMDMPGVVKEDVTVTVEEDRLAVTGEIRFGDYEGMRPVYTEYNVGHFERTFVLSNEIDRDAISAEMKDGVLTLRLPKAETAKPRRIEIG